ncbi:porin [Klebsiella pneumoniae]|uniref:porin n=1 Tax=Klebsiella pneumoniae TaxID=573 RepID=UPI003969B57E
MGSCAAPSAKGDDKFITTDYLQQCPWYYFNKNMNVYAAYKFNQLDDNDYTKAAGVATDDQAAVGIVYQF